MKNYLTGNEGNDFNERMITNVERKNRKKRKVTEKVSDYG